MSGHGENKSCQALLLAKVPEKTILVRPCFLPSFKSVSKHRESKSGQALLSAKLPECVWAWIKQVRSGTAFCQASRVCLGVDKTIPVRPCFSPRFRRVSGPLENKSGQAFLSPSFQSISKNGETKSGQALPLLWAFMWCWRVSGLAKAAQHSLHWNPFSTCILACFHRSARDLVR